MPRPEPRECIEDGAENSFKECKLRVEAQKEEHEEEDDAPGQNGKSSGKYDMIIFGMLMS